METIQERDNLMFKTSLVPRMQPWKIQFMSEVFHDQFMSEVFHDFINNAIYEN